VEQWPELKAQQRLQAALDPAEVAAAQQRCKAFLEGGLEAVGDWWLSDPSPAEQQAMQARRQGQQQALDLFD
jgi:hypothetical protein